MLSAVGSDDASQHFGQAFNFECFVTFIIGGNDLDNSCTL